MPPDTAQRMQTARLHVATAPPWWSLQAPARRHTTGRRTRWDQVTACAPRGARGMYVARSLEDVHEGPLTSALQRRLADVAPRSVPRLRRSSGTTERQDRQVPGACRVGLHRILLSLSTVHPGRMLDLGSDCLLVFQPARHACRPPSSLRAELAALRAQVEAAPCPSAAPAPSPPTLASRAAIAAVFPTPAVHIPTQYYCQVHDKRRT